MIRLAVRSSSISRKGYFPSVSSSIEKSKHGCNEFATARMSEISFLCRPDYVVRVATKQFSRRRSGPSTKPRPGTSTKPESFGALKLLDLFQ